MVTLFSGCYKKLLRFVFEIYDFSNKSSIQRTHIKSVFSYIPLNIGGVFKNVFKMEKGNFKNRLESQDELYKYIDILFNDKDELNFDMFKNQVEHSCSEVFIYVNIAY